MKVVEHPCNLLLESFNISWLCTAIGQEDTPRVKLLERERVGDGEGFGEGGGRTACRVSSDFFILYFF